MTAASLPNLFCWTFFFGSTNETGVVYYTWHPCDCAISENK